MSNISAAIIYVSITSSVGRELKNLKGRIVRLIHIRLIHMTSV